MLSVSVEMFKHAQYTTCSSVIPKQTLLLYAAQLHFCWYLIVCEGPQCLVHILAREHKCLVKGSFNIRWAR